MSVELLPVSVIIPTGNRAAVLRRTIESLAAQSAQPQRILLVDASGDLVTRSLCAERPVRGLATEVIWLPAEIKGAASQRNQGLRELECSVIGFFDDDILFEPDCIARLWRALHSDNSLGGVNAMIINQRYQPPGRVSRLMFRCMGGRWEASYAGRVLGPAVNLLPEDHNELPEVVPVEWLNSTCTFYRRAALPEPPFPSHFTGYSIMEDLTLSLTVARRWRLANARTARIFHDSQSGEHKSDAVATSRMELVNRHYVMTEVMDRGGIRDYGKLAIWELYQLAICALQSQGGRRFWSEARGKIAGVQTIIANQMRVGRR
jgi:glycosyltransferase involved in cell wall biosynthesis